MQFCLLLIQVQMSFVVAYPRLTLTQKTFSRGAVGPVCSRSCSENCFQRGTQFFFDCSQLSKGSHKPVIGARLRIRCFSAPNAGQVGTFRKCTHNLCGYQHALGATWAVNHSRGTTNNPAVDSFRVCAHGVSVECTNQIKMPGGESDVISAVVSWLVRGAIIRKGGPYSWRLASAGPRVVALPDCHWHSANCASHYTSPNSATFDGFHFRRTRDELDTIKDLRELVAGNHKRWWRSNISAGKLF